ncbi:MAG: hypothetical protein OFPII_09710 [Osedax symbiont Rs1]|nr:MAG: hypothetical protein OFPII_09710 [Osedax symbiont Rs1]
MAQPISALVYLILASCIKRRGAPTRSEASLVARLITGKDKLLFI